MSSINVLLSDFFIVWIIIVFLTLARFGFHFYANKKIVELLAKNGFIELSARLQNAMDKERTARKGSTTFREWKEDLSSWSEFRKLDIEPQMRELHRLQLFCKVERIATFFVGFLMLGIIIRIFLKGF